MESMTVDGSVKDVLGRRLEIIAHTLCGSAALEFQ